MPTINPYYDENAISQRYRLADALRTQPQATSWAGVLAQGLGGLGGGLVRNAADSDLQSNAAMRSRDIQSASGASDMPSLSKALLGSQVPELQSMGLKTKIGAIEDSQKLAQADAAKRKEYEGRAMVAEQYGMAKGSPEWRQFVLTGDIKDPLDAEYKRAQINSLNEKADDPVAKMLIERLRERQPAAAAPAPSGPTLQPQSFDGTLPAPGVQLIADETQAPGQTQPVDPQAQSGMIDTPFGPMSEQEARDLAGPMLLNPKYAPAGKAILDSIDASGGGKLAKPTVNQIEERTMNSALQLGRIADIRKRYDENYLKVPNRVQMLANAWTAKAGGSLSPDQQKELTNYAAFRSAAVNNLNTILKELSGAAVTPQEYERIQNDVPTAGTGVFDGDDPVSFKAKLDRTEQTLRMAIARQNFMRSQGLSFTRDTLDQFLALEDVPAAIDRRGSEIEQRLLQTNPKLDPMQLDKAVRGQLKREFGI